MSATIRGIDFGSAWAASGAQNFFGEGWPYHRKMKNMFPKGFDFSGATFVAKTTTLDPREGNMPLNEQLMPTEKMPTCIHVNWWSWLRGAALNAVGLSGTGARNLFEKGKWQERTEPFFLSFMSVAESVGERTKQFAAFVDLFAEVLPYFQARVGLQLNVSCPNVGHGTSGDDQFCEEVRTILDLARQKISEVPIVVKITATVSVESGLTIAQHEQCDGLCVSNTISWNDLPRWVRLRDFGRIKSPLQKFGGGGYSGGSYLRKLTLKWIREFRERDQVTHINAGGGILHPRHAKAYKQVGASSVSLGSIAFLRPWRLQKCIKEAQKQF